MFQPSISGATAPTLPSAEIPYDPQFEAVRHMIFGPLSAVQATVKLLHKLNYAEPNDWSKPIATGQSNEVVVVLIRRIRIA